MKKIKIILLIAHTAFCSSFAMLRSPFNKIWSKHSIKNFSTISYVDLLRIEKHKLELQKIEFKSLEEDFSYVTRSVASSISSPLADYIHFKKIIIEEQIAYTDQKINEAEQESKN